MTSGAAGRTIVGVFGHPDDESLLAGGTLARLAADGVRTAVISCTGGEAGESWDPTVDPARLAEVRRDELRQACARLGVGTVEILGYRDSGIPARGLPGSLAAAAPEEIARAIVTRLRPLAPDVVLTHDPAGGYGHPDHIRTAEATRLAVAALERPPRLYHCVLPKRVIEAFSAAFRAAGLRAGRAAPAGADMERDIGVDDDAVTTTIDVAAYARVKREAVRAHRTQMTGHVLFRLPWPVLERLWSEEHFSLAAEGEAPPTPADLL